MKYLLFFISISSFACLYFREGYDRKLFEEKAREVFMYHDGKLAHIIVKSSYQGKLPDEMAWVLPLPSKPLKYDEADPELFSELLRLAQAQDSSGGSMPRGLMQKGFGAPSKGIRVHEEVRLENYKITPIEILSSDSGKILNQYLASKKFLGMPEDIQKPYLKKGAYFLAINIVPPKAEPGAVLNLKPLHIQYESGELRFPLRFTHDYRTFDLNLYFYTFVGVHSLFSGGNLVEDSWGEMGLRSYGDKEKLYPKLSQLMKTQKWTLSGDSRKRALFDRVAGANKKFFLEVQRPELNFDLWNPEQDFYRMPISGVNTRFKTRELKEDPGLTLY